jgi:hypothetical protein
MPRNPATNAKSAQSAQSTDETSYDIITIDAWDPTQHNCGLAKDNKSGQGRSAPILYNGKKFYLKVPKMYTPFGASMPKPKPGEAIPKNPKWTLQMAFGNDPACEMFRQKAEAFDEFIKAEALRPEIQQSWLKATKTKPLIDAVVDKLYSPMVKPSMKNGEPNPEYPPFMRAGFSTTYKEPYSFTTEVFDDKNEPIPVSMDPNSPNAISKKIPQSCNVSALLQASIWATNSGFGVTWSFAQLKVFPVRGLPKGKCLVDDPEDDETGADDEQQQATASSSAPAHQEDPAEEVQDETVEEVVEEVVEEETGAEDEPTPAPVAVAVAPVAKTAVTAKASVTKPVVKK